MKRDGFDADAVHPDDVDTGEPIAELARFSEDPTDGFVDRVRRRVERRSLGANLGDLIWHAPGAVMVEVLAMLFGLFAPPSSDEGESK